jgi:hypothetical protein
MPPEFTQKDFDNELFKADYNEFKGEIGTKLDQIIKKLDAFDMIFIVNGGSDGKEVGFKRKDLFQILYDNGVKKTKAMEEFFTREIDELKETIEKHIDTGFKSGIGKLNWWSSKLLPIIILAGVIVSIILVLIGQHELAQKIQNITKN